MMPWTRRSFVIWGAVLFMTGSLLRAGDWPQWRGPDRTDVSTESNLLRQWPEGGPRLLWTFEDAGIGHSGIAIVADRLYTMGARGEQEMLLCLDVSNGRELWATPVGGVLKNGHGDGPRGTPTVTGDRVYAIGGRGDIICAKVSDGTPVWRRRMRDFGGGVPGWGYTESPLVVEDRVICTPGGKQGAIVALDAATGKRIWQSEEFTDRAQYSSPIAVTHGGVDQVVQLTMKSVVGISMKDGRLLWRSNWPGRTAVVPTPIFHAGGVYVSSGYGVGCKLVKIGDSREPLEVYANKVMKNHHGGVVLVADHLYGYSDGPGWVCQDFQTGKLVWKSKALGKGSVTCAGGMLYCYAENNGTLVLAEATPEAWRERGRFRIPRHTSHPRKSGRVWTHPVVANGRLYLRDQELIFCYDVRAR